MSTVKEDVKKLEMVNNPKELHDFFKGYETKTFKKALEFIWAGKDAIEKTRRIFRVLAFNNEAYDPTVKYPEEFLPAMLKEAKLRYKQQYYNDIKQDEREALRFMLRMYYLEERLKRANHTNKEIPNIEVAFHSWVYANYLVDVNVLMQNSRQESLRMILGDIE